MFKCGHVVKIRFFFFSNAYLVYLNEQLLYLCVIKLEKGSNDSHKNYYAEVF